MNITPATVRTDGEAMAPEMAALIAEKFRTQIGGAYNIIAAQIETDHPKDTA
jgi:hypothetical protein